MKLRQLGLFALYGHVVCLTAGTQAAQAADPCREGARAASTAAQDYRQNVQRLVRACGTELQESCDAAKSAADTALGLLLDSHVAMTASCTGTPPPPPDPTVQPGELVITEVMADPANVADTAGEWFEIRNVTTLSLDLGGLTILDSGTNQFTISNSIVVPAGGIAVLGIQGDPNMNGGVLVDYVYTNFTLANSGDTIAIYSGSTLIDEFTYEAVVAGRSLSLDPDFQTATDNDDLSHWCSTLEPLLASGDTGSPGAMNEQCP